jgi:hypothetical protein
MSALDVIRVMCIKMAKLDDTPQWRIFRRKKYKKEILNLYNSFTGFSIYEKMSAISSIAIQYYIKSPEIIPNQLKEMMSATPVSITVHINKLYNKMVSVEYDGDITFITKSAELDIDTFVDSRSGEVKQYKFLYGEKTNPTKLMQNIFNDINYILDFYLFFDIICYLADIINYPVFRADYFQEFVDD